MGNCLCCKDEPVPPIPFVPCIVKMALKVPHGTKGVYYHENQKHFTGCDINEWVQSLYHHATWTGWIVYNDDAADEKVCGSDAHAKGILAWNATHVSWLVHSVPNFPRSFTGSTISPIESPEHMYGQSFMYVERPADNAFLTNVITQLYHMDAHINMKQNEPHVPIKSSDLIRTVVFSDTVTHISKSPSHHIDIYGEHLTMYSNEWLIQTWKRGHPITKESTIKDITHLCVHGTAYKGSQDHSKWGVCPEYIWVGDLNRMQSQAKRGGGGFLVKDKNRSEELMRICVS